MKKSRELGMQTFDQALFDLYEADKITYEDALRNADSVNDLRLNIKLNSKNAKNRDLSAGTESLGQSTVDSICALTRLPSSMSTAATTTLLDAMPLCREIHPAA